MMGMPDKCNVQGCFTMPSNCVTESVPQPKKDFHCPFLPVTMPMPLSARGPYGPAIKPNMPVF